MWNIALSTVKKPKTLNTDQKAIWSGMWVISLGLFLIAGGEILSTYGWSLYSAFVWGAVGLGPLLILTMLCGFNMSETREEEAFDVAISPRAGQFRQAGLRFRAGRQLQWSSLVRTPVIARVIPLAERHLQPGCDQSGLPGQPYLRASVPNLIFQAPIVALALIASSAGVASASPSGLEPVSAMYWCTSDLELNAKNAITVWVDKTEQVVAVSPSRDGSILPAYAQPLVLNDAAESGLTFKKTKTGYFLTPDAGGFSHQFKIANTVATCKQTSDD